MFPKKRFEISRQYHYPPFSMHSLHSHSYYEMYYLIQGKCSFFIRDKIFEIKKGMILFIKPGILHKTTYNGKIKAERICVEFTEQYITDLTEQYGQYWLDNHLYCGFFTVPKQYRSLFDGLFEDIFHEYNNFDSHSDILLKLLFQRTIVCLIRYGNSIIPYETLRSNSISDERIQAAVNYISTNYAEHITLSDVASFLHLNPSYLSTKFKLVNGMSFKEYLNTLRLNHAEKLLLESNKSITEIAMECGYDNGNYFGDIFRKINGISPTEFRRNKGNHD